MAAPTLEHLLRTCERSAVHLEMRDGYMADDPLYTAWKAGHRLNPANTSSWWRPWLQTMADTIARGIDVRRARIVSEPVSQYIRFEYEVTFTNTAAGEKVRWLPRSRATDIALPGNDFWAIDDSLVMVHHFSGEGDFVTEEITSDPAVVKLCVSAFETVWERAVPHNDYRPA